MNRPSLSCRVLPRLYLPLDSFCEFLLGLLQVVIALQTQPEFRARPQIAGETQGSLRCNSALAVHDLVEAAYRHTQRYRERVHCNTGGNKIILAQDLAGMDRRKFVFLDHRRSPTLI